MLVLIGFILRWYFNDEFALILNTLGEDNFGATPLEPSKQHKQAQAVMFNRISDCYTRMFWKVLPAHSLQQPHECWL